MAACNDGINIEATQRDGTVSIAGIVMHRKAFAVTDASPLYEVFNAEGSDLSIPFRNGSLAIPRRRKTAEVSLPFVVDGQYAVNNSVNTNVRTGIAKTLFYLKSTILGTAGGDGTRAVSLVLPDGGGTHVGVAHVTGWEFDRKTTRVWAGNLNLAFPDGTFL